MKCSYVFFHVATVCIQLVLMLLCRLVLKLLQSLTIGGIWHPGISHVSWASILAIEMVERLEVADVWLESDCENQTLLKPLK